MIEVKPIVVIYLPEDFGISASGKTLSPIDLMDALNGGFGRNDGKIQYTDYWKDYYWLSFWKPNIDTPELKVFYPKDFTEIQYQELKDMLAEAIRNLQENKNFT